MHVCVCVCNGSQSAGTCRHAVISCVKSRIRVGRPMAKQISAWSCDPWTKQGGSAACETRYICHSPYSVHQNSLLDSFQTAMVDSILSRT